MKQNEIASKTLNTITSAIKQELAEEALHNITSAMKQNEIATETLYMNTNVMVLYKYFTMQ